jgi:uncharacterized repeat protein (TIGR03806 family)
MSRRYLHLLEIGTLVCAMGTGLVFAGGLLVRPFGLDSRPVAKPWLRMAQQADGKLPARLSLTGAFKDTRQLSPSTSLIPYQLNVAFWSDGAQKLRWMSVPNQPGLPSPKISFASTGEWTFPNGTLFVKHFELSTNDSHPDWTRRLETRLLVRDSTGGVYGVTYKWRPDNRDADLLNDALTESIRIQTTSGWRTQSWYYPSRKDCLTCHTPNAGGVLGVKTRQLNCDLTYPGSGVTDNQLRALNHIGLFQPAIGEEDLSSYPKLARLDDHSASLEIRARSYLDADCSHCHRPGGVVSYMDTRFDTPLPRQNLVEAPVVLNQGLDGARAIAPNDIWRSIVYQRISTLDSIKMPPLAHQALDTEGIALLREWIQSLPGPTVLAPPVISPNGGDFHQRAVVSILHDDPTVSIRYTLDGAPPGKSSTLYEGPFVLLGPTTVRARAYKDGMTRSIPVQETFIIGD